MNQIQHKPKGPARMDYRTGWWVSWGPASTDAANPGSFPLEKITPWCSRRPMSTGMPEPGIPRVSHHLACLWNWLIHSIFPCFFMVNSWFTLCFAEVEGYEGMSC